MIYVWYSDWGSIGYIASEDFSEVYDFFRPGSDAYKINGLELSVIEKNKHELQQKHQLYYCGLYKGSKESYQFANWDEFWEWFMVKYGIEML